MFQRAYSVLHVKSIDAEQRVIRGIATTPTPDRVGDIVVPTGIKFKNPMPLLLFHQADKPVGTVKFEKPTKEGIRFEARLPKIANPGTLQDRVEEAWQSIKAGLISGVSIGFRSLDSERADTGGIRFTSSEVFELSLVSVPANAEAKIEVIRSIAQNQQAAFGRSQTTPGVAGNPTGRKTPMNISEQIKALENKRGANVAAMETAMQASIAEGRSTTDDEQESFDSMSVEVKQIDADLARLRALEKAKGTGATPVTGNTPVEAAHARSGIIVREPKAAPGVRFARLAISLGKAQGNYLQALAIAEKAYADDKPMHNVLKAAVAAGTTSHSTWAKPLVGEETAIFADFVEFLRPQTILGKFGQDGVPSLRKVPFRVPLIGQTSGGDAYWVGESQAIGFTKFDFARKTLQPTKVGNIAVCSEELIRDSSPSAEILVRDQLAAALRERVDLTFIDPNNAGSAGVRPASITNGVSPLNTSGDDAASVRKDIRRLFGAFIASNNAPTSGVWIMRSTTALALSLMVNPLGQPEFPGIDMNGGRLFGLPVIVSEYVPGDDEGSLVVLANAGDIYEADEGEVAVDFTREASLQMDSEPNHNSSTPTAAQLVSLFQTDSVGFKATRTVSWELRRPSAVAVLADANWGGPVEDDIS